MRGKGDIVVRQIVRSRRRRVGLDDELDNLLLDELPAGESGDRVSGRVDEAVEDVKEADDGNGDAVIVGGGEELAVEKDRVRGVGAVFDVFGPFLAQCLDPAAVAGVIRVVGLGAVVSFFTARGNICGGVLTVLSSGFWMATSMSGCP